MGLVKRLVPFWISLGATPFAMLGGFMSAGAGHGDYLLAKILFPFTMLSTVFLHSITSSFIVFAIFQFPVYGLILSFFDERKFVFTMIAVCHTLLVIACLILIGSDFGPAR